MGRVKGSVRVVEAEVGVGLGAVFGLAGRVYSVCSNSVLLYADGLQYTV